MNVESYNGSGILLLTSCPFSHKSRYSLELTMGQGWNNSDQFPPKKEKTELTYLMILLKSYDLF